MESITKNMRSQQGKPVVGLTQPTTIYNANHNPSDKRQMFYEPKLGVQIVPAKLDNRKVRYTANTIQG